MVRFPFCEPSSSSGRGVREAQPPPRICAVVVTYRPDAALLARLLQALASQVTQVLVLDNASPAPFDTPPAPTTRHHRCFRNRGLGWTQNLGARWAWRAGFDAVLLMDQDSVPAPGMVAELVEGLRLSAPFPVAAVGPRPADAYGGRPFPVIGTSGTLADPSARMVDCAFMIASGMLIPRTAWQAVGPMNAALFIDHIDTDWCLRARAFGWSLRIATRASLEHRLGEGGRWLWIGRWRWFPHHGPLRHYYMLRNSLWLVRQPTVGARLALRLVVRSVGVVLFSLILLPDRMQRLHQVIRATRDAFSGIPS